ncbi:MAG TPA: tetratricopeptide repeat protein [Puia sp.]|nr:tetratricopeptide repeat protein [Puia sp.]
MTPDQRHLLIDHLDESLRGRATATLEEIIGNDPEAEKEWNYLRLAVDAVRDAGLNQQVAAARAAWKAEFEAADSMAPVKTMPSPQSGSTGKVRTLYRYTLRAAACILIITGSSALYKYVSVSSGSLYDRYYTTYTLGATRGAGDTDPIVQAYDAKDWTTVRNLANTAKPRTNQTDFLAGMACLEQKQYDEAISHFEQIIAVNTHAGTSYYQDEAEYYLAISWLAHKNVNEAMPILEKILTDQHHQYHEKVMKMSFFDLRLAQYKENK